MPTNDDKYIKPIIGKPSAQDNDYAKDIADLRAELNSKQNKADALSLNDVLAKIGTSSIPTTEASN